MADSWPYSDVGEPVDPKNSIIIRAKAGGSISKGQLVKVSAAADLDGPTVVATAAGTDVGLGVAIEAASSGEYLSVLVYGPVKATAGGAVTAGAKLDPAAGGKVAAHGTGTIVGTALTGASADGDTLLVWINGP